MGILKGYLIRILYPITTKLVRSFSKVGYGPTWSAKDFPWAAELEASADIINAEFEAFRTLCKDIPGSDVVRDDSDTKDYGSGHWGLLLLRIFDHNNEELLKYFPKTFEILNRINGVYSVRFNLMAGDRKEIKPHRDGHALNLNGHLPLTVPDGRCEITVGDRVHQWKPGQFFAFDTSITHSVYKESDKERLILNFSFYRPVPKWVESFTVSVLNSLVSEQGVQKIFDKHNEVIRQQLQSAHS